MLRNAIILEERDVERAMAISVANSLTNQIEENSIQLTVEESQTPAGPVAGASKLPFIQHYHLRKKNL